jgi:hypothetical protein
MLLVEKIAQWEAKWISLAFAPNFYNSVSDKTLPQQVQIACRSAWNRSEA